MVEFSEVVTSAPVAAAAAKGVEVEVETLDSVAAGIVEDVAKEENPTRGSRVMAPVVVVVVAVVGCGRGGTMPEERRKFWKPLVSWLVRKLDRLPLDMGTGGPIRLDMGAMGPLPTI